MMKSNRELKSQNLLARFHWQAVLGGVTFTLVFLLAYQNCGKGFRSISSRNSTSGMSKNFVYEVAEPLANVNQDGSQVTVVAVGTMAAIAQKDARAQVRVEVRWGDGEPACSNEAQADRASAYSRITSFIIPCSFEYSAESVFFIYYYARVGDAAKWELVTGRAFSITDSGPTPLSGDTNRNGSIEGSEKGILDEAMSNGYRCDYGQQMEAWVYDPQRQTSRDGYRYVDSTGRRQYLCVKESCVKTGDYFFGHYPCCEGSRVNSDTLKCEAGTGGVDRIGDTNRNGHIDKFNPTSNEEIGSIVQAYTTLRAQPRCNPTSTLKDWAYNFNNGDSYRASNGEPGYVCLENLCVPQGKVRKSISVNAGTYSNTFSYSCCDGLAPDTTGTCRPIPSPTPPSLPSLPPGISPITNPSPRPSTGSTPSPLPSVALTACGLTATPPGPVPAGTSVTWNITGPGAAGAVAYLKQWAPVASGPGTSPMPDLRLGAKTGAGSVSFPQPSNAPLVAGTHHRQAYVKDSAGRNLCNPGPTPDLAYVVQPPADPRIDTVDVVHQDSYDADSTYLNIQGLFTGITATHTVTVAGSGCPTAITKVSQDTAIVQVKFPNLTAAATCRVTVSFSVGSANKTASKDNVAIAKYTAPTTASIAAVVPGWNDEGAPGYTYLSIYGNYPELTTKTPSCDDSDFDWSGYEFKVELSGTGCPAQPKICPTYHSNEQVNVRFPNLSADTNCNVKVTYAKGSKNYSAEKAFVVPAHSTGGPATVTGTSTNHFPNAASNLTHVEIYGTFPGIPTYENITNSENPAPASVTIEGTGCPGGTATTYQSPTQINVSFSNLGAPATCTVKVSYMGSLGGKTAQLSNQAIRTYPHISDHMFVAPTVGEPTVTYLSIIGYFPQLRKITSGPFNDATVTSSDCSDISFAVTYQGDRGGQPAGHANDQINARYQNISAPRACTIQIRYSTGGVTYMDTDVIQLESYTTPQPGVSPSQGPGPGVSPDPTPSPSPQVEPSQPPAVTAEITDVEIQHSYADPGEAEYTYLVLWGSYPGLASATPGNGVTFNIGNCNATGIEQLHQSSGQINLRFRNLTSAGTCNIGISYFGGAGTVTASKSVSVPAFTRSPTVKPTITAAGGGGGTGCDGGWVTGDNFPQKADLSIRIRAGTPNWEPYIDISNAGVSRQLTSLGFPIPDSPSGVPDPDDGHDMTWQEVFAKIGLRFTISNTAIPNGWETGPDGSRPPAICTPN